MDAKDKIREIFLQRNQSQKFFVDVTSHMIEKPSDDDPNIFLYKVDDFYIFIFDKNKNILYVNYDNMVYYLEECYNMTALEKNTFLIDNCKKYLNWDLKDIKIKTFE